MGVILILARGTLITLPVPAITPGVLGVILILALGTVISTSAKSNPLPGYAVCPISNNPSAFIVSLKVPSVAVLSTPKSIRNIKGLFASVPGVAS